MKGATTLYARSHVVIPDFNPRSREGSDYPLADVSTGLIHISIHAPVKGATKQIIKASMLHCISIHAPVKGATASLSCMEQSLSISIHAPVKGAT